MNEYNEKLNADRDKFKNGPIAQRSVSDWCCCLIFLVAIVGYIGASAYGWKYGEPRKLLIGWDSDGNGCGYSTKTLDYPYLYWPKNPGVELFDAIKSLDIDGAIGLLKFGTCVKECP